MESYNKLVRDKIPAILDAKGVPYEKRVATPEEFKEELLKKLGEEMNELKEAIEDPEKQVEELADVIEVLMALKTIPGTEDIPEVRETTEYVDFLKGLPEYRNVEEVRLRKREERGGFDDMLIVKGEK